MLRPFSLLLAAMLFSAPAWSQEVAAYDRFQLWNDCGPVGLLVEGLPNDAADIGLTKDAIETAVRSRLRAARIYESSADPYLYVNVNVFGHAFSISIYFNKPLFDAASATTGYAITWNTGFTGYSRDASYIISGISQGTDRFIDEYLRVNEAACTR